MIDEELEGEAAAMQFAGGRAMAEIAADWERDLPWVEAAVRRALLQQIPQRMGGLMPSRAEARGERSEEMREAEARQASLEWQ